MYRERRGNAINQFISTFSDSFTSRSSISLPLSSLPPILVLVRMNGEREREREVRNKIDKEEPRGEGKTIISERRREGERREERERLL